MHKKRIFKFFRSAICAMLALSMIFGDIGSSLGIAYAKESTENQTVEQAYAEEVTVEEEEIASNAEKYGLAEETKDGVILHAFCWSFNTIKENMKDIAEAGYTTVQTSPANACNDSCPGMVLWSNDNGTGGCWWWHYQPTDWTIGNYQLGTADDYKAMCEEADKYGVKIITDVIPNHTTPDLSRVASGLKNAGGGLNAGELYHANGFKGIENSGDWSWGNRLACTTGMMGGLPDVNTEKQDFQAYYLKYCNDLIALGCDGFRYDTAKHIGVPSDPTDSANTRGVNDFWDVATGKKAVNGVSLSNADSVFIYGEVLQGDNVPTSEYANYMYQTASNYGGTLRSAIGSNDFSVGKISDWSHTNPSRIVSWVESHDTYCNDHESGWMTDWQIRMCWAIIAARKDGVPLWMSRPAGSDGHNGNYWGNNVLGAKGNDQFKDPEVVAVNKFRTAMVGQGEYLRNPNGSSQILQIDRGTKGTCIINLGGATSINNDTTMADGTYTDQVSGREFTVSGGKISGQLDGGKIAVIYNATTAKTPKISSSVASGKNFTTDSLSVTISVSNATSASYSINGGTSESFSDSKTITIGAGDAYGTTYTINVKAQNSDGDTEETYTYTKTDPSAVNVAQIVLPSGWSEPVYCYAYDSATETKNNGTWPGVQMTKVAGSTNTYEYTIPDTIEKPRVIFYSSDTNRSPADQEKGYLFEDDKSTYKLENGVWSKVTVTATNTPTPTTKPTDTPTPTIKPTDTPTPTPIPEGPVVVASMADGTTFDTETATVKLTLSNAEKGTYSVDNGPVKEFTGSVDVVIGKGKIADSDVTVKTTATGDGKTVENTYTYRKQYVADVASAPVNSEETVTEASVNATAETGGMYATNPNGQVGKRATITIDGSFSDWSADMLIAQGGAWDIANNWKGGHENCVLDDYALYAAWDDENLYIGWQMVNTTDTWAKPGDGPLSDGGRVLDVPLMIALNVGNRTAMTGKMANGGLLWDALDVSFKTRVDNILLMSGKVGLGTPGYFIAADASGGASYAKDYCLSFATEGISYKMAEGCLPTSIMGLEGSKTPSDVYDSSLYADMMSKGHDTSYDSFYEINIPLKTLGIDSNYIEQNGIGVMQIATRGTSGIDCIPHDPSMLDNATGDCAVDPSSSHEKDDSDVITVPLASVGNINGGGSGGGTISTVTPTPTVAATVTPTPTVAATVTPTPIPVDVFHVNFGADRSAPQYNTTALSVKAIVAGGTGTCSYEFFVDGQSVQSGASDTYTWQYGTVGAHKIKVVVTDSEGKTVTCEKDYDLESDGSSVVTPTPTEAPTPTSTVTVTMMPTQGPTPSPVPTEAPSNLKITKFTVSCKTADGSYKVGDEFVLRAGTADANGTPLYMFTYIVNGEEVIVKNYGPESEASFVADTTGSYTFKVYVVDNGNNYSPEFETGEVVVKENIVTATPTPGGETEIPMSTPTPIVTETPIITGVLVPTATPTPIQGGEATPTPGQGGEATPTPVQGGEATPTPGQGGEATPTPGQGGEATPTPGQGGEATPTPIQGGEATPTPTNKPTATKKPTATPTSKPTATPTQKATPTPVMNVVPKKGMVVVDDATEADYTVVATGSQKAVEFTGYAGSDTTVVVPDTIKIGNTDYKVTSIANNAFEDNDEIKAVTIGKNVTKIGKSAFAYCSDLQIVKLGANVTTIGDKAFYGCKKLRSITLNSKLTTIGKSAFYKCTSLQKITIPSKVNKIGAKAFYGCKKLKTITIKTTKLKSSNVGKQAFKGIYSKATIKVPKSKLSSYKKLLKSKGVSSKAKIKK